MSKFIELMSASSASGSKILFNVDSIEAVTKDVSTGKTRVYCSCGDWANVEESYDQVVHMIMNAVSSDPPVSDADTGGIVSINFYNMKKESE